MDLDKEEDLEKMAWVDLMRETLEDLANRKKIPLKVVAQYGMSLFLTYLHQQKYSLEEAKTVMGFYVDRYKCINEGEPWI